MSNANGSHIPGRLRLSSQGQHLARQACNSRFNSKQKLADLAKVDRVTVYRFLDRKNLLFDTFDALCVALDLNWEDLWEPPDPSMESSGSLPNSERDIDTFVQQLRAQLHNSIHHDCGTVPLWGHNLGQPMDQIFIDISLTQNPQLADDLILDETHFPDANTPTDSEDLDTFDRLGYQPKTHPITGSEAAQKLRRMFVYGQPGSGKTTYLQWLALQCVNGDLLPDLVPVFLPFGTFLEDALDNNLRAQIIQYFSKVAIANAAAVTDRLLTTGRLLLLLDGFDELPENIRRSIQSQIRDLISRFKDCHFVVSCRPPLRLHHLIGFEIVEIAEFRRPQIQAFAKRWFELIDGYDRSERFMERLRRHPAIGELAKTPLLLPMLCSVFAREGEFPANRMNLYRKGFDILLSEWDDSQYRYRDNPYSQLTFKAKRVLLSVIATHFFRQGKTLFHRQEIENLVERFFSDHLKIDALAIEPGSILEAMELQHGLIVRRAANYFSFSHLTFQEYLIAVYLVSQKEYPTVYENITNDRWKFVIEIISELLSPDKVDDFLIQLKHSLDGFIANHSKLQEFVSWLDQFIDSPTVQTDTSRLGQAHKKTLLRAHYFVASLEEVGKISGFISMTKRRDLEFPDYYLATSILSGRVLDIHTLLFRIFYASPADHNLFFGALKKLLMSVESLEDPKLKTSLEAWDFQIQQQLINFPGRAEWWEARHGMWRNRVQQFMSRYFQIRCDWNFSDAERHLLRQYYDGTKLLAECINLSRTSKENYSKVAESLLKLGS